MACECNQKSGKIPEPWKGERFFWATMYTHVRTGWFEKNVHSSIMDNFYIFFLKK